VQILTSIWKLVRKTLGKYAPASRANQLELIKQVEALVQQLEVQRSESQSIQSLIQNLERDLALKNIREAVSAEILPNIESARTSIEARLNGAEKIHEYSEKALHLTSLHYDLYKERSGRPYFTLSDGWALTFLDTGQPFFVDTRDREICPWIIMGGVWETNVDRPLLAYADHGMTVLDIGANVGYYTVKLGTKVGPQGRVLAFEPNPLVQSFLKENIKLNGQTGWVEPKDCALGDRAGVETLRYDASSPGGGSFVDSEDAPLSVDVQVFPLDEVVPDDWAVDLIKLDAEGYEKRILDGGKGVLARSPSCAIMLELRLESWERFAPLEEVLPACGGNNKAIYAVEEDGRLEYISPENLRPFLLARRRANGFHENYFFILPKGLAHERLRDLVRD
jgi:FkbM family methyltransferase